jgi:Uma2 family endonuclease
MAKSALAAEEKLLTYAEYKTWNPAETGRYELIYGTAYAMSGPSLYHQSILGELLVQIGAFLRDRPCRVYPAPLDVRLFYEDDENDDTVVQPDLVIICDEKKRGPEGCRGAPDFVAEILSPSNTASEMERKFELYRQAGVREYWVIDPQNKMIHAHGFSRGQIVSRFYSVSDTAPIEIFASSAQGLEINVSRIFAE